MTDQPFWSIRRVAGSFLILGFIANLAGVIMFNVRAEFVPMPGVSRLTLSSTTYYTWERTLLLVAIVLTAIGFVLLERYCQNTAGRVLARISAIAYLLAGILGVAYEALDLSQIGQSFYPLIFVYVVLAFLAQVAIGFALRQARLLATWIGWATILWNLGWLVVLLLITPRDIYFPILHHVMPLVIGVALLRRAPALLAREL